MKEVLMFTIFHAKITRYPLMPVQKNILFKWISHYESHGGPWLGKFPWRECRFYWSDAMAQSDVLGAASSFSGDVYLQNEATDSWAASGKWDPEIWGALIAPSAVHELRHLYQRRKLGLLIYAILALPVLRNLTLEKDASAVAEKAEKIIKQETDRIALEKFNRIWRIQS